MSQDYFSRIIKEYSDEFRAHGDTPAGVNWASGRQEIRFAKLTRHFKGRRFSVLDYGCGLAHMEPFIRAQFPDAIYIGADVTPDYINYNRAKHQRDFYLTSSPRDVPGEFDYVVMSGVIGMRYTERDEDHFAIVGDILKSAFGKARVAMAFNFMHDWVDFQRPASYHQNVGAMLAFARTELTPWLEADLSYLPYECTVTAFKNAVP